MICVSSRRVFVLIILVANRNLQYCIGYWLDILFSCFKVANFNAAADLETTTTKVENVVF